MARNRQDHSMTLFDEPARMAVAASRPLAERMRPRKLDDFVGQHHLTARDGLIRQAIENDRIFSMILWGPPGCGKTTLARIMAAHTGSHFAQFSAVLSGIKEIRAVIEEARNQLRIKSRRTLLFVDEIHRFNKSQQDAFLQHVESGLLTLIGATTENPSFEVIAALMSRCRVITLERLEEDEIVTVLKRALADAENGLGQHHIVANSPALTQLARAADGDLRAALNALEIAASLAVVQSGDQKGVLTAKIVADAVFKRAQLYDKAGEEHYNLISALHKSMRGSDPDAALYWFARMLEGGEDPLYIGRRVVRFASEDVGNASPYALRLALDAVETYRMLGSPEGELALAQAIVYLATAPKSNRIYAAYQQAREAARQSGSLPVPMHIRNAPTRLMKKMGYGDGYQYAHDYEGGYVPQEYLPDALAKRRFYRPSDQGQEKAIAERMQAWEQIKQKALGKK